MPTQAAVSQQKTSARQTLMPYQSAVRLWLSVVAAFIAALVLVGGLTRLTDSGLSITEWQLISGALPPLSEEAWRLAFAKYREIPEYKLINSGMSLSEFKAIYWWEWGHRFLGRIVGFVFFVPFVFFWLKGALDKQLTRRLLLIFLLGGLQGALGWYMVKSGLVDRVDVSQYRLAAHLGLAVLLFGLVVWTALRLEPGSGAVKQMPEYCRWWFRRAALILTLVFVQILLGALVAGTHAGRSYNTWPLMDGSFLPAGLFDKSPLMANFFENIITIQFNHRIGAYLIVLIVFFQAMRIFRARPQSEIILSTFLLVCILVLQTGLGIWTLLAVVPINLAVLHQLGALVLFAAAIFHLHTLKNVKVAASR